MMWWIIIELLLWQMARYVRRSAKASPITKATTSHNKIFITNTHKK